jgi:miniconductance mechanosensitive channel
MLERYLKIQYIRSYVERKTAEVNEHNQSEEGDLSVLANGRRLTNIGTFRAYVVAYLWNHPKINREMTFLVRQLAPTDHGLPIEIYVFCNDVVWANYEGIQADIFDHLLAIIPAFDLRVFQTPSGADFRQEPGEDGATRSRWPWRRT